MQNTIVEVNIPFSVWFFYKELTLALSSVFIWAKDNSTPTWFIFNPGVDLIRQNWSKRGPNVVQEGYGSAALLPEQGIYLAASVYRPVLQVWAA